MKKKLLVILSTYLLSCTSVPSDLTVVNNFEIDRFLGTWYEIARLNHKEERNLQQVSATYSLQSNGSILVVNKGFNSKKNVWKSIEGKARFNGPTSEGRLKVSFFGPFYGGYNILKLEEDYSIAMVAGPNRKYLWILARDKQIKTEQYNAYIEQAKAWGFATSELIVVEHE